MILLALNAASAARLSLVSTNAALAKPDNAIRAATLAALCVLVHALLLRLIINFALLIHIKILAHFPHF